MAYSVSFVANYIKSLLEGDFRLGKVEIEGEISDITYHTSGYIYFTLKDEKAILRGIMYKREASLLKIRPKTGDKVIATGRVSAYTVAGYYQIVASKLDFAGEGALYQRFLQLKEELRERGLFDEQYKRPIPKYIKTLGVVTSPTGAAIRDIINITRRRNPFVSIILYPSLVQGEGAAFNVAEGIMALNEMGVDLIICGRGGGSMEDLWAFNEEILAEAIFSSEAPIISAVGHETDFTIADFVADLRAPTPSAAAELGVYDVFNLIDSLKYAKSRMESQIQKAIEDKRQMALSKGRHLSALSPEKLIEMRRQSLVAASKSLNRAMEGKIELKREAMRRQAARLSGLSPVNRLAQGYAYVTGVDGKNIYKIADVNVGDELNIKVTDGEITAEVTTLGSPFGGAVSEAD